MERKRRREFEGDNNRIRGGSTLRSGEEKDGESEESASDGERVSRIGLRSGEGRNMGLREGQRGGETVPWREPMDSN